MEVSSIKSVLQKCDILGDCNNTSEVHVELQTVYSVEGSEILNVFDIYVPETKRNCGIATKIILVCEELAQERGMTGIWVGPFVTEESAYLLKICQKYGYRKCMPFGMIKQFDTTKEIMCVLDAETYIRK